MHITTWWTHNQICVKIKQSDVGRMWQLNICVYMFSHITLQWWICLMRGQWMTLVIVTVSIFDYVAPSLKYAKGGLGSYFFLGLTDLIRQYSNLLMRYWNFIWLLGAWNCKTQKCCQKSLGESCKAFHCCNNLWSRCFRSKWWKISSMRSWKYSIECTLFTGRLQNHRCGDSWSVYASSRLAYS